MRSSAGNMIEKLPMRWFTGYTFEYDANTVRDHRLKAAVPICQTDKRALASRGKSPKEISKHPGRDQTILKD